MRHAINIIREIGGKKQILETIPGIANEADAMKQGTEAIARNMKSADDDRIYWDWAD